MEKLAILWAVWIAHSNFKKKNIRSKVDLLAYQEILKESRYLLEVGIVGSDDVSDTRRGIAEILIEVLDARIDELDNLIQLDPLVLGTLRK